MTRKRWGELKENLPLERPVYWIGEIGEKDDFGMTIKDEFIDGRLEGRSQWAIMTPMSWRAMGVGSLGTGMGQRYKKQKNGKWLKVEG